MRLDLWIALTQLDRGYNRIDYERCVSHLLDPDASIGRLSLDLEASLYLHHLICKRKNLVSDSVQNRILDYVRRCRIAGMTDLAEQLECVRNERKISLSVERQASDRLHAALDPIPVESKWRRLPDRIRRSWLSPPRTTTMISIMGCDGAGKTTLAENLSTQNPNSIRVATGKHLYRKSLTYKLAVIFLRPLITRSRERFDEILAPWLYLRACVSLQLKLMFGGRRLTLVDRSPADFLYVDRKTDRPSFCRSRWLMSLIGRRIPTIHCHVSHENVMRRKLEMTSEGHATYDRDMFEHFTRRVPTDYIAFNNNGSLPDALLALNGILAMVYNQPNKDFRTRQDQTEGSPLDKGKESENGSVCGAAA